MIVRVRNINDGDSVYLIDCGYPELESMVNWIRSMGGFYHVPSGEMLPFHSYQLVLDDEHAYAEIIVGKEE